MKSREPSQLKQDYNRRVFSPVPTHNLYTAQEGRPAIDDWVYGRMSKLILK